MNQFLKYHRGEHLQQLWTERKNRSRRSGLQGVQVWASEINSPPHLSDSLCCKNNREITRPTHTKCRGVGVCRGSASSRFAHQGKKSLRGGSVADLHRAKKGSHQHLGLLLEEVEERPEGGRGRESDWWPLSSLHNCSLPAPFARQVLLTDQVPG